MTTKSKAPRRQLDNSIAEVTRQLVELIKQRVDADRYIGFDQVNRVVINSTHVGVVFVDESDWAITEWRRG